MHVNSIYAFRDSEGRQYTVVIDGRVIDGLGPDELTWAIVSALTGASAPYGGLKTMDELRERERASARRLDQLAREREDTVALAPAAPGGHFGGLPWEPWTGGEMPVEEGEVIDVRHRNGKEYRSVSAGAGRATNWSHVNYEGDIVAWRRAS